MWQTRVISATATGGMGWVRRLRAYPKVTAALRDGRVSVSWAEQMRRLARPDRDGPGGDGSMSAACGWRPRSAGRKAGRRPVLLLDHDWPTGLAGRFTRLLQVTRQAACGNNQHRVPRA
jgi:hypothetical protein